MMRSSIAVASSLLLTTACSSTFHLPMRTTEAASDMRQVTGAPGEQKNPTLSHDGTLLAFEQRDAPASAPRIQMARIDSPGPARDVQAGSEPTFMPDGSGLVIVAPGPRKNQLVQTIGENAWRPAFSAPLGDPYLVTAWPAVSPNGHSVAISLVTTLVYDTHAHSGQWHDPALAITDLHGTGLVTIGDGDQPAWSPDGKHIAFVKRVGERRHVFVVDPRKSAPAIQISEGADDDSHPAWSPDGTQIVFCSTPAAAIDSRGTNLFVAHADGTALRQLTEGENEACRPSWNRDGSIYFHANVGGGFHVWRLRPR
jgi:Tol biopolymer transport system component